MKRPSFRDLVLAGSLATATILTAAGSTGIAVAQDQGGASAGPRGGNRGAMGKVLLSLGLSDQQKSQIKDIMATARAQARATQDRDQKRAAYKTATDKIDTVLTPAQRTEFHAKMDAMRKEHAAQNGQS
jgi:Spy/CpxP family protein refolding chaperone